MHRATSFFFFLCLFISKLVNAVILDPPELKCIEVLPNGDIEITWVPPPDPMGEFDSYDIYSSTNLLGPYTLTATEFSYLTNSYVHAGADGQNQTVYYYIHTRSASAPPNYSVPSDTLQSMLLSLFVPPPGGIAVLNWNAVRTPKIGSSDNFYTIFQEYPLGTWSPIGTSNYGAETYRDTVTICSDTINYRVEIADQSGCTSVSSIVGDWLSDEFFPSPPIIETVGVDTATGLATICWFPNTEPDIDGYIVLINSGMVSTIIDTAYSPVNSYTNTASNANNQSETYGLAAHDTCWSGVPASPNTSPMGIVHQTIYLEATLDPCARAVELLWNKYINWSSGVAAYQVWAIENNGAPIQIANNGPEDTTAIHTNLNAESNYCYVVKAIPNGSEKPSLSNKQCLFVEYADIPAFHYLAYVSVLQNGHVELKLHTDAAAEVSHYRIDRSISPLGPFVEVGNLLPPGPDLFWEDESANTSEQSYYYQVVTIDSCEQDALTSNAGRTIHLRVTANSETGTNFLQWTPYELWDAGVLEYQIYRGINGFFDPTPIATLSAFENSYEDDVSEMTDQNGQFCYYVIAREDAGNSFGLQESSRSNTACAFQTPLFWVPNAFVVGGANDVFKPVTAYVNPENYRFQVFTRWGALIFETDNLEEGWDGSTTEGFAQEGVYIYAFSYLNEIGQPVERRGGVTLLRKR